MAEAAAAFVVKMLALKGAEATVVAAAVNVAVNVAAYAAVNAVTRQNSEQKQQGGLIDLQLNSSAPRQLVIGKRMTGGVLVDWYLAGSNNTKLYMPVYLSEGPCGQVTRVFADGRQVWNTPLVHGVRTTIPDFRSGGDRLWLTYYDGRVGQTADPTLVALGQGWTSANTMTGCAYVVVECQWDSDNMRSPPSLSFEMEGAKLYDRRLDSTAGGSGSHRIDNPATWAWSDNPMVALDHFLLGRYWGGARTFGIGLSADEVPYSYFAAQANICDEDVALKAGGTQKRYRANGFIAANEDYASTITKLCTAMAARPADFGGRFGVIGVESKTPVLTIDDGDLIAGVQEVYTPKRSWSALVGEVEGRFQDPAQLYQPTPYPNVTDATWEAEDGGEPKLITFDLEFETHVERAQRLATLKARAERRQATLSGSYPLWTIELERGDWFVRTGAKWGVDGKTFEVIERVLNTETYTVTIVSQEVDATDSAWDESVAADGPPAPIDGTDTLSSVTAPALTVTSNPIVGAASNTPALKIAFTNPTDPRVHTMFVEVYRNSDGLKVATAAVTIPDDDGEVIIQNGIADGVLYDVRAKYLTPGLPSDWSSTASATTASTYATGSAAHATTSDMSDAIVGQGDLATANRASLPFGANGLVDCDFIRGTEFWAPVWAGTTGTTVTTGIDLTEAGPTYYFGARRVLWGHAAGTPSYGAGFEIGASADGDDLDRLMRVKAGDRLYGRVLAAYHRALNAQLRVVWRDMDNVYIDEDELAGGMEDGGGGGVPENFGLIDGYFTAPTGAAFAEVRLRVYCNGTDANPLGFFTEPMLTLVPAGQTAMGLPYYPGRQDPRGDETLINTSAAITGQGALATLNALTEAIANASDLLRRASGGLFTGELNADLTSVHTAAAIAAQGDLATLSSLAYGSGYLTGFGGLAALGFVTFGSNVRRSDGTTSATDSDYRTALGVASSIASQGALATLNTINSSGLLGAGVVSYTALAATAVRLNTNIVREDGTTAVTDALVITTLGVASAITSQGALATLSYATGSYLGAIDASNMVADPGFLDTAYWLFGDASTAYSTASEITSTLGAPKGVKHSASGATSQTASLARTAGGASAVILVEPGRTYAVSLDQVKKSGATGQGGALVVWWDQTGGFIDASLVGGAAGTAGSDATERLLGPVTAPAGAHFASFYCTVFWTAGIASAGEFYQTRPRMRRAAQLGTMMVAEDGTTLLTNATVITSGGTAAAISGQGGLATLSFVTISTNLRLADGTTVATTAMVVTASGTAAAIASQGALATLNTANTSQIAANAVTASDDDETDTGASISSSWVAVASADLTTADAASRALIMFSAYIAGTADGSVMDARIKRDATVVWGPKLIAGRPSELDFETTETGAISYTPEFNGMVSFFDTDVPGSAGTYTYSIELRVSDCSGSNPWDASYRRMFAMVFKR